MRLYICWFGLNDLLLWQQFHMNFKPTLRHQKIQTHFKSHILIWITQMSNYYICLWGYPIRSHLDTKMGDLRSGMRPRLHDKQQSAAVWLFIHQLESHMRLSFSPTVAQKWKEAKVKYYWNAVPLSPPLWLHAGLLTWPPQHWTKAQPVNNFLGSTFTLRLIIIFSKRSWTELENSLIQ